MCGARGAFHGRVQVAVNRITRYCIRVSSSDYLNGTSGSVAQENELSTHGEPRVA